MYGQQKTFGNGGTPVSFLTHQVNHSRKSNRLVINFGKRKQGIIFPGFGYFLGKKRKKNTLRSKRYGFSSAFREFTYYKLKLRNRKCVLYHSVFRLVFYSSRDFLKLSQIKTVQLNIRLSNNNKLFLWFQALSSLHFRSELSHTETDGSLTTMAFSCGSYTPNNIATDCSPFRKYLWFWKRPEVSFIRFLPFGKSI